MCDLFGTRALTGISVQSNRRKSKKYSDTPFRLQSKTELFWSSILQNRLHVPKPRILFIFGFFSPLCTCFATRGGEKRKLIQDGRGSDFGHGQWSVYFQSKIGVPSGHEDKIVSTQA